MFFFLHFFFYNLKYAQCIFNQLPQDVLCCEFLEKKKKFEEKKVIQKKFLNLTFFSQPQRRNEAHRIVLFMLTRLSELLRAAKRVLTRMIIGGIAVDCVTPLLAKARKAKRFNIVEWKTVKKNRRCKGVLQREGGMFMCPPK